MHCDPVVFIAHVLRVADETGNLDEAEVMLRTGVSENALLDDALWYLQSLRQHIEKSVVLKAA